MDRSDCLSTGEDANLGRTLRDRYRIDERIGSGSMGSVYRAWDLVREQACAVKLLRLQVATRESIVVRFCDEARIVARLCHPSIVELYDQGEDPDGTLFLIMELLRGQDLYAYLRAKPRLPLCRVLEIVRQIGSALHTVHLSGVVHRDIKPRNVFLTQRADSSEPGLVKVIDFGLAKFLDGQGSSRGSDGLLIGTPEYLAPEAWRGISSDIDARSDQWSLAVLTYRMLAGRMPFDGSYDTVMLAREILSATPHPLRQLVPDLPLHVEAAITQALAKDKGLRFPSVLDFVRALHGLPLSSTVQLRRDAASAPLPDGDRPTAALLDYGDRPTAALLDYSDRPTAALQLGPELTAVVASSRSPPVEQTALLPALPVAPAQRASLAASAATPAQPPRPRRWRPLVAALGLVVLGAAAGIAGSRPPTPSSGAAPRAEPAPLASVESLQSRWPRPAEATTPALSSLPGRPESAASSTCSCPPPPSVASPCPVSAGASPSPGHRAPPTRHKLALKPMASAAVRRYLNRPD